jgi:hypothetical protein
MTSLEKEADKSKFVTIAILATVAFAIVMAVYVFLAIADEDTDTFLKFLTVLVVTIVPASISAFRANAAATSANSAVEVLKTQVILLQKQAEIQEGSNASQERLVTKDDQQQHPPRDQGGAAT